MKQPLAEGWAEYSARVLEENTPDEGRERLKTIFFAGAVCAMRHLTNAKRGDIEAMKQTVDEIMGELHKFADGMMNASPPK